MQATAPAARAAEGDQAAEGILAGLLRAGYRLLLGLGEDGLRLPLLGRGEAQIRLPVSQSRPL
jgi:hypothetical protein